MSLSEVKQLALDTYQAYTTDHGERLAAALAYYATFSLAPLIVLVLAVAGLVYGRKSDAAQEELMTLAGNTLGADGAALLESMLEGAVAEPTAGVWATILSSLVLVIGATALFARLQDALNTIWGATPQYSGVMGVLWSRGLSLLLVIGAGAIMVASLLLSSLIAGLADWFTAPVLLSVGERLVSLALLMLLFATLYRTLPDAPVRWTDVWFGALIAATLATLGTWALGWYLGHASVTSSYGSAGALVTFLLWIYYSAQIFFLGAEWTTVYARREASPAVAAAPASPEPSPSAPPVTEPQTRPSSWRHRLGWIALGIALAQFFRR